MDFSVGEDRGEHRPANNGGFVPTLDQHSSGRAEAIERMPGWRSNLGRALDLEIIPRLVLARRNAELAAEAGLVPSVPIDMEAFIKLTLADDDAAALEVIADLNDQGMGWVSLMLGVLTPAARGLGAMWETDACDFLDVTRGLARLHHILRTLAPDSDEFDAGPPERASVALTTAPGDTHLFGVAMVEQFFHASRWVVQTPSPEDVFAAIADRSLCVVGFSLSCHKYADALSEMIRKVRRRARNPALGILVGGHAFSLDPDLARRIGADAVAADGRTAVLAARNLIDMRVRDMPVRA